MRRSDAGRSYPGMGFVMRLPGFEGVSHRRVVLAQQRAEKIGYGRVEDANEILALGDKTESSSHAVDFVNLTETQAVSGTLRVPAILEPARIDGNALTAARCGHEPEDPILPAKVLEFRAKSSDGIE